MDTIVGELRKRQVAKEDMEVESAFLGQVQGMSGPNRIVPTPRYCPPLFGHFCDMSQVQFANNLLYENIDAFSVLMSSQRHLSQPGVPEYVRVITRKDKLLNDVVGFLNDQQLLFSAAVVLSTGKAL